MIINTTNQLNAFVVSAGITAPTEIIPKLVESKVIISSNMAKLIAKITDKAA